MRIWALLIILCGTAAPAYPQGGKHPDWAAPMAPFRIADNLYYVGSRDLASSPALIRRSVGQLGFHFGDIHILLISHAHFDHDAGSAAIKRMTGARYMVMDSDVRVVESGGAQDFFYPNDRYPPAEVDRVLHDGDKVRLGGAVLVAHKTPGHTRGCTTWTMRATEHGKPVNVVIVGSWNVNPGYRLLRRPGKPASYPGIADDYRKTFAVLKGLPCDVFLGAHGEYFDMLAKLKRANAGVGESVWIDPEGYRKAVAEKERQFETELRRQESGSRRAEGVEPCRATAQNRASSSARAEPLVTRFGDAGH
ncbi:MAG TPA: MBL fold metallo-hydrolase [Terriglobia bacterium]|nr:MBL fold metallo-hydrolase [Terriglobia bacterium]